jgi:hypothetical protein
VLSCHAALVKGVDVDKLRNLAKSVTVEEGVLGGSLVCRFGNQLRNGATQLLQSSHSGVLPRFNRKFHPYGL